MGTPFGPEGHTGSFPTGEYPPEPSGPYGGSFGEYAGGYGPSGGYGPPPGPPVPTGPQRRRHGWGPFSVGIALLAVIGIVAAILAVTKKDSGTGAALPAGPGGSGHGGSSLPIPSGSIGPSGKAPLPLPSGGSNGGGSSLPLPSNPGGGSGGSGGGQTVNARNHGVAYDVPAGWKINDPGAQVNVTRKDGTILATSDNTAELKPVTCKGPQGQNSASLASSGISSSNGQPDPAKAAEHAVVTWADGYYQANGVAPGVRVSPAKQITVDNGKSKAWLASAQVTPKRTSGSCANPPSAVEEVLAVPGNKNGSVLLVLRADQGVPNAVSPSQLDNIAASVRKSS